MRTEPVSEAEGSGLRGRQVEGGQTRRKERGMQGR